MWPFFLFLCLVMNAVAAAGEPPLVSQEDAKKGGAVLLTRPDGTPVYVNPNAIALVRGPLEGEGGHTTIVFANGGKQTVLETVEQITKIMDAERGEK